MVNDEDGLVCARSDLPGAPEEFTGDSKPKIVSLRGRGLATALLNVAKEYAASQGCEAIDGTARCERLVRYSLSPRILSKSRFSDHPGAHGREDMARASRLIGRRQPEFVAS
jgi:hypothetical protein